MGPVCELGPPGKMGRCPRADHHPPEWVPSPRTGFPPGRRQQRDGRTQGNGQAAVCVREGSGFAGLSPEAQGPMGPMLLWERRRATGNLGLHAQATRHAASGGCGPTAASAGTRASQGSSATSHLAGLPGPSRGHKDTWKETHSIPHAPLPTKPWAGQAAKPSTLF